VGFLLSNVAWIVYAIATGALSLLAQNLGFTVTSLIGIYRHRADLRATAGAVAQLARRNFSLPIRCWRNAGSTCGPRRLLPVRTGNPGARGARSS
jgi:hypothetical protein